MRTKDSRIAYFLSRSRSTLLNQTTGIITFFVFIVFTGPSWADPIYVFREKNSDIRLTNRKPPTGVEVKVFEVPREKLINPNKPVSTGTGWFTANGLVVTNHHVVRGYRNLFIRVKNGEVRPARIVRDDPTNDISILSLEMVANVPAGLSISLRSIGMGAEVFTIG